MYNKPITARIASSKKQEPSVAKQTVILKKEQEDGAPALDYTASVDIPGTPGGKKTTMPKSKGSYKDVYATFEDVDGKKKNPITGTLYSSVEDFIKEAKEKPAQPTTVDIPGTPDTQVTATGTLYGKQEFTVMPKWMQKKYMRGLKTVEKEAGKALKRQLKAGDITSEQYETGLKTLRSQTAESAKEYARKQAEATKQSKVYGKTATEDVALTLGDISIEEQKARIQQEAADRAAIETSKNQGANAQRTIQTQESEEIVETNSAAPMRVGPLKMKSSFKMGGYGSKTYNR